MLNNSTAHAAVIDKVYSSTIRKRIRKALASAHISIGDERGTVESLAAQPALPPHYRHAYGQLADALLHVEKMIEAARKVGEEQTLALMKERARHPNIQEDMPVTPESIRAVQHTINEINAVEVQWARHGEAAKAALREHDESGLDWNELEYDFCLLLDPGPARAFYDTCGAGDEPLEIPLGAHSASFLYEGLEIFN